MEPAGRHALRYAAGPAGSGQVPAAAPGDARTEVARPVLGGNVGAMRRGNSSAEKALDKCKCETKMVNV